LTCPRRRGAFPRTGECSGPTLDRVVRVCRPTGASPFRRTPRTLHATPPGQAVTFTFGLRGARPRQPRTV